MIRCLHCGLHRLSTEFLGEEAFSCPRCGMDESGLEIDGPIVPIYDVREEGPATRFDVVRYHGA